MPRIFLVLGANITLKKKLAYLELKQTYRGRN